MKIQGTNAQPETLGEHIKKRRGELGHSQNATAVKLKTSVFSLLNWEKGRFQPTRAPTLKRIIEFLGYDPFPDGATVSERLRAARRRRGWGQWELAQYLGVDRSTVTSWESGARILRKAHRAAVASFIGMAVGDLNVGQLRER